MRVRIGEKLGEGAGRVILQFDQSKLSEVLSKINRINQNSQDCKIARPAPSANLPQGSFEGAL